jgi:hypothetical protein
MSFLTMAVPMMWAATVGLVLSLLSGAMFPAAAEEVYNVGGDVTAPKLVHKAEPKYTKRAKKAKLKGTVSVIAVVNSAESQKTSKLRKASMPIWTPKQSRPRRSGDSNRQKKTVSLSQ